MATRSHLPISACTTLRPLRKLHTAGDSQSPKFGLDDAQCNFRNGDNRRMCQAPDNIDISEENKL